VRTVPCFLLPLVASLFLVGAGCAGTPRENKAGLPGFPVQVTDDAGRQVTVPSPPERIVSLAPSITEILFALGLEAQVVGVTDVCDYPPAAKQKEKIGSFVNPSLEKIVALKPDLVLAADINQKVVARLERLNVPAIVLKPRDVDGVLSNITLVGRATGRERQAADLVRELRARIDAVVSKVAQLPVTARPKVYYEVWYEPLCTAGPGTFIDDVIRLAGGVNVAADAPQSWPQYSLEVLLRKNPDVMLHSYGHDDTVHQTAEDIARRPGWSGLNFVRHRRIYVIDADLITRPGPRLVKAVEEVAQMLHPEVFVKGKASVAPAA